MSELDSRYVKQGLWVNEAQGNVMGRTITTTTQTGTIIVALLAVLASLASTHLWHLLTFLHHQLRSRDESADGLFRQQQALLRTLPSPSDMLADYTKLWWAWRNRAQRPLKRLLPQMILAAIFTIGTVAVSIVSTYIIKSDNIEVLVNSPFCASLDPLIDGAAAYDNYTLAADPTIERLSEVCYQQNSTGAECQFLIAPRIPLEIARVDCPFQPSICLPNYPAIHLDSGLQDVNKAFGLNTKMPDRVWYRKSTTCAILNDIGRTKIMPVKNYPEEIQREFVSAEQAPNQEILQIWYGRGRGNPFNSTFDHSLLEANISSNYKTNSRWHYVSDSLGHYTSWSPIPELIRDDADLVVKPIGKGKVKYNRPINDPVFAAHVTKGNATSKAGTPLTFYYSDFPISTFACAQQYQFCFRDPSSKESKCSKLSYLTRNVDELTLPAPPNPLQREIIQSLLTASQMYDISTANFVSASKKLMITVAQGRGLPDDQWVEELVNWESYAYAGLQNFVVDRAIGPQLRLTSPVASVVPANTTAGRALCGMQRMHKAGGFVNINVFGLAFIITFACVVTILDICLLRFLIYLSLFRQALAPRIDQWIQDGVWQLQRHAYEASGEGTWSRTQDETPVTDKHEQLGVLSLHGDVRMLTPRGTDQISKVSRFDSGLTKTSK